MPIDISSTMDGGNIKVISAQDPGDVRLKINPEPYTPYDKV